jgi:hypothetical protein
MASLLKHAIRATGTEVRGKKGMWVRDILSDGKRAGHNPITFK